MARRKWRSIRDKSRNLKLQIYVNKNIVTREGTHKLQIYVHKNILLTFHIFVFLLAPADSFVEPSTHIDENRELTIGVRERQIRG